MMQKPRGPIPTSWASAARTVGMFGAHDILASTKPPCRAPQAPTNTESGETNTAVSLAAIDSAPLKRSSVVAEFGGGLRSEKPNYHHWRNSRAEEGSSHSELSDKSLGGHDIEPQCRITIAASPPCRLHSSSQFPDVRVSTKRRAGQTNEDRDNQHRHLRFAKIRNKHAEPESEAHD